jgi:sorbitol-specific phosphotransferase system component IIC
MSKAEAEKVKPSFTETVRTAWRPYRRLYSYVKPYKWRFAVGLAFGVTFGLVNSLLPVTVLQVSNFIFHGAAPNPRALVTHREMLNVGPKIDSVFGSVSPFRWS